MVVYDQIKMSVQNKFAITDEPKVEAIFVLELISFGILEYRGTRKIVSDPGTIQYISLVGQYSMYFIA